MFANRPQHVEPGEARHADVEEDQVEGLTFEEGEGRRAVRHGRHDVFAPAAEESGDEVAVVRVVVGEQDAARVRDRVFDRDVARDRGRERLATVAAEGVDRRDQPSGRGPHGREVSGEFGRERIRLVFRQQVHERDDPAEGVFQVVPECAEGFGRPAVEFAAGIGGVNPIERVAHEGDEFDEVGRDGRRGDGGPEHRRRFHEQEERRAEFTTEGGLGGGVRRHDGAAAARRAWIFSRSFAKSTGFVS